MSRIYPYPFVGDSSLLFLTDTHFGRRAWTSTQLATAGRDIDYLEQFVDGVAVGGDLVHWANAATPEDGQWAAWYAARGKTVPWARVAGNHDLASFGQPLPSRNATQWLAAIGETQQNQSRDLGNTRLIAVTPDTWARPDWDVGMSLSTATLDWLEAELAASTKPAWIVGHNPLAQQYAGHMATATQNRLTSIINGSGRVIAWLSGHLHANIKTATNHARQITVGSRRIAAINGPAAGGQVSGTTLDPWDSPLRAMLLTYQSGKVTCRWRNIVTRTWDVFQGSRVMDITIDA